MGSSNLTVVEVTYSVFGGNENKLSKMMQTAKIVVVLLLATQGLGDSDAEEEVKFNQTYYYDDYKNDVYLINNPNTSTPIPIS